MKETLRVKQGYRKGEEYDAYHCDMCENEGREGDGYLHIGITWEADKVDVCPDCQENVYNFPSIIDDYQSVITKLELLNLKRVATIDSLNSKLKNELVK